jgi:hypothetical protein
MPEDISLRDVGYSHAFQTPSNISSNTQHFLPRDAIPRLKSRLKLSAAGEWIGSLAMG